LPKIKYFIGGSFQERIKPLFPSYLFVRFDLEDADHLKVVRYTRGVNKIIGGRSGPISIQKTVIETIRGRIGERGYIEQGMLLKQGDRVVVRRGVLRDLIGVLEKPMDDRGRVEILFKIVYHQMKAKVHVADLEKTT